MRPASDGMDARAGGRALGWRGWRAPLAALLLAAGAASAQAPEAAAAGESAAPGSPASAVSAVDTMDTVDAARRNAPGEAVDTAGAAGPAGFGAAEDAADPAVQALGATAQAPVPDTVPEEEVLDVPAPGFIIPIQGDVFYEPGLKMLASLPGTPPASMVLLVDGYPVDAPLNLADGLLSIRVDGLGSGVHTVTLLLFNERTEIIAREEARFFIRLPEPQRQPQKGDYRQFGRIVSKLDWKGGEAKGRILSQSELKLSVSSGGDTSIVSGREEEPISQEVEGVVEAAYNLKYRQFQAYGKVLARTDENRFRQPANRITTHVKVGPWASLKAGDVYPLYNPLILSGTRVRGGEGSLGLVVGETQYGSLRIVRGESRREVPAYIARYDTGGASPRIDTVPGTFAQDLTAARLGFGGGPRFDLGLTLLKATDRGASDEATALNNRLRGLKPAENLVSGADLRIGLWDGRIQLFGEYAFSLFTKDRSLGAFATDSFDVSIDPEEFDHFFVFNATTRGWQYLVESETSGREYDALGFVNVNSAYNTGFVSSIPLPGLVTETEFRYTHHGLEYHSEGNPFLGGNPGDGFTFIQRLVVLDNTLTLGLELGNYRQELGFTSQIQRTMKAEIRYMPGPYTPSFVIGGGRANIAPEGDYPHQFRSSFLNFNTGAYHQFQMEDGKLHATLVYGYTQDDFELEGAGDSHPPSVNRTHIVNTSAQYRMRYSGFMPKVNYSFAHNGIQMPAHTAALGFIQTFAKNRIRLDASGMVGQYPETNEKNDLSLGQTIQVDYALAPGQNFRLREKWVQYGKRRNILVGATYELFF